MIIKKTLAFARQRHYRKLAFRIASAIVAALVIWVQPLAAVDARAATVLQDPNATTITLEQVQTVGQPTVRTWSASGGFVDSGSWFLIGFHDTGSFVHSPVVGAAQFMLVLVGQDGSTITLAQEELITLQPDGTLQGAGSWHIVDGSGIYSTLQGAGQYSVDIEFGANTRSVTWQLDGNTTLSQ